MATIEATINGGKASMGPPLGPGLSANGLDAQAVIAEINEKTKAFSGMQVPVSVIVDDATKEYTLKIGAPPMFSLIKLKAGIGKGSGSAKNEMVGNLTVEAALEVASMKAGNLLGASTKTQLREVVGTCVSCGVTVDGLNPREFNQKLGAGEYDHLFE